jgi:hypothetical protein
MGFKQKLKKQRKSFFVIKLVLGGLDFRPLARDLWIKNREGGGKAKQTTNKEAK